MTRSSLLVAALLSLSVGVLAQDAQPPQPQAPDQIVAAYLNAWKDNDLDAMYALTATTDDDPDAMIDEAEFKLLIPKLMTPLEVVSVKRAAIEDQEAVCSYTATFSTMSALMGFLQSMQGLAALGEQKTDEAKTGAPKQPADDQAEDAKTEEQEMSLEDVGQLFGALGRLQQQIIRHEAELAKTADGWKLMMWYDPETQSWHLPGGFEYPKDAALRQKQGGESRTCPHCEKTFTGKDVDDYVFCPFCAHKLGEDEGKVKMQFETP